MNLTLDDVYRIAEQLQREFGLRLSSRPRVFGFRDVYALDVTYYDDEAPSWFAIKDLILERGASIVDITPTSRGASIYIYPDRYTKRIKKAWSIKDAGRWLADKWAALEGRYGRTTALTMALSSLLTFPLPGNIALIIAAAEVFRGLTKSMDQDSVIAVDFNRTLCSSGGPDPEQWGPPEVGAVEAMNDLRRLGYTICINSVVGDSGALASYLDQYGIAYDYINESPAQPNGSSHKLNAMAYIDDRAIPYRGDWSATMTDLANNLGKLKSGTTIQRRIDELLEEAKTASDDDKKRIKEEVYELTVKLNRIESNSFDTNTKAIVEGKDGWYIHDASGVRVAGPYDTYALAQRDEPKFKSWRSVELSRVGTIDGHRVEAYMDEYNPEEGVFVARIYVDGKPYSRSREYRMRNSSSAREALEEVFMELHEADLERPMKQQAMGKAPRIRAEAAADRQAFLENKPYYVYQDANGQWWFSSADYFRQNNLRHFGELIEVPAGGYKRFKRAAPRSLYTCPKCKGDMHNGPIDNLERSWRGGVECSSCGLSCSVFSLPVGDTIDLNKILEGDSEEANKWLERRLQYDGDDSRIDYVKYFAKGGTAKQALQQAHQAFNRVGYGWGEPRVRNSNELVYNTTGAEDAEVVAEDIEDILRSAGLSGKGRAEGDKLVIILNGSR